MDFEYLTLEERKKFEEVAFKDDSPLNRSLILLLLYSGGSVSDIMGLEVRAFLYKKGFIRLPSIYRRDRMTERKVPVPRRVLDVLNQIYLPNRKTADKRIFPWKGKRTFERRGMDLLKCAGISSNLKSIHNSFGIYMASEGYPLSLIAIFMGYRTPISAHKFAPWLNTQKMYDSITKARDIEENYTHILGERDSLKNTLEFFFKEKRENEKLQAENKELYEEKVSQLNMEIEELRTFNEHKIDVLEKKVLKVKKENAGLKDEMEFLKKKYDKKPSKKAIEKYYN